MKSCEPHISPQSDYFVYEPGREAREAFLYPVCTGHFYYEPGYRLNRTSFNSFLLLYVKDGSMEFTTTRGSFRTAPGQFVLLDCYQPHSYRTEVPCDMIWLHFDGHSARTYYDRIRKRLGEVFTLSGSRSVLNRLNTIYSLFQAASPIDEVVLCKLITDILTELSIELPLMTGNEEHDAVQKTISYISEHLAGELSISRMAARASLSTYHFIRVFKKGTGYTPHEYIMNMKLNNAKYLLKNTNTPIKEICFSLGYSSESIFSTAFKKHTGMSPRSYRECE